MFDFFFKSLTYEGYTTGQVINQLHDEIVFHDSLNDKQKSAICEKIAVSYYFLFLFFLCIIIW